MTGRWVYRGYRSTRPVFRWVPAGRQAWVHRITGDLLVRPTGSEVDAGTWWAV